MMYCYTVFCLGVYFIHIVHSIPSRITYIENKNEKKIRSKTDIPQYILDMYNVIADENGIRRKEAPDLGKTVSCIFAQGNSLLYITYYYYLLLLLFILFIIYYYYSLLLFIIIIYYYYSLFIIIIYYYCIIVILQANSCSFCHLMVNFCLLNTVEPLIAATFTAKVRWPLLGGGRYSEVYYNMGKRLGLKVSGRYREVSAIRRWPLFGGGRYSEVSAIRRWPLFGGGRYSEVAALRGSTVILTSKNLSLYREQHEKSSRISLFSYVERIKTEVSMQTCRHADMQTSAALAQ